MEVNRNPGLWLFRSKCNTQVPTALLYKGNRSPNLNVSLVHDSCKNNFHVSLRCDSRDAHIWLRFSGPEVFLVTLHPKHAAVLEGQFQLKFTDKIHSYTIEAFVPFFLRWNDAKISSNHLLMNSTSYFRISENSLQDGLKVIHGHLKCIKALLKLI